MGLTPASDVSSQRDVSRDFCSISLSVTAKTSYGQSVFIMLCSCSESRSCEACCSPQYTELVTTPASWPIWQTSEPLVLLGGVHRYKYGVLQDGRFDSWEFPNAEDFREINLNLRELMIADVFGTFLKSAAPASLVPDPASADSWFVPVTTPSLRTSATLFIVCFHLPVVLKQDDRGIWEAVWSESLIARTRYSIADEMNTRWVGTISAVDAHHELSSSDLEGIRTALQHMGCTPLFMPSSTIRGAYLGYCKQILWPSFHNVDILDLTCACWNPDKGDPSSTWDQGMTEHWWEAYQTLNHAFCDELCKVVQAGDVVWVHDYHLMLLPKMLSSRYSSSKPAVHIIFFLHIPFPTSQIFRSLTRGHELLSGIIGANAVGFHAFDHARHFLNACKRLMGASYQSARCGLTGVECCGRIVTVVVRCVSIEPDRISEALREASKSKDAHQASASSSLSLAGLKTFCSSNQIVMAGIDTCQRLSGVALKLLAFERFLWDYDRWQNQRVLLVQYVLREGKRPEDESRTSSELRRLVHRINTSHPGTVVYHEKTASQLSLGDRLSLWRTSSVLVGTAIREGLNLAPFEYLFCRQPPGSPGVILASEFSATSSLLNGALRLNPFDVAAVAFAFDSAISMPEEEQTRRCARDLPYLMSRHSGHWTRQILNDTLTASRHTTAESISSGRDQSIAAHKQMQLPAIRKPLLRASLLPRCENADEQRITQESSSSARQVFLLDYGGTLVQRGEHLGKYLKGSFKSEQHHSDCDVVSILEKLSMIDNWIVFVISGMSMDALTGTLGHFPKLGLAASNGLCHSSPCSQNFLKRHPPLKRCWHVSDYEVNWGIVKQAAMPILKQFTARTNGSSILSREPGVGWSYYRTDPEWGRVQARELKCELDARLAPYDVDVRHTDGTIELTPRKFDKGHVTRDILKFCGFGLPGFIFSAGDDALDEDMYSAIYSYLVECRASNLQQVCTLAVGKEPSRAIWRCKDASVVNSILSAISTRRAFRRK